jgi:hypothetical protein
VFSGHSGSRLFFAGLAAQLGHVSDRDTTVFPPSRGV